MGWYPVAVAVAVAGQPTDSYYVYCLQEINEQRKTSMWKYNGTPLIRVNWYGEASGYPENPDNWIFL
jgi:hypothetical protein